MTRQPASRPAELAHPLRLALAVFTAISVLSNAVPCGSPARADEPVSLSQHEHWVTGLAFTLDGRRLITVGGGSLRYRPGDAVIWNVATGKRETRLTGHDSHVWAVAVSPAGNIAATADYSGRMIVWDLKTGKPRKQLDHFKNWVQCIEFSPDGKLLAAGGQDGSIAIWTTAQFSQPTVIKPHEAPVTCLAFVDENKLVTAGLDKKLLLVDHSSPKDAQTLHEGDDVTWAIAVSPQGTYMATGGADRMIRLWEPTGKLLVALPAHGDWIHAIEFSPDGKELASAGHDKLVRRWNVADVVAKSGELAAARRQLADARTSWTTAFDEATAADEATDQANNKVAVVELIESWKEAVGKQQTAQAALEKAKDDKELKKAAGDAKAAATKALAAVDAKIKLTAADKKLSEELGKLKQADAETLAKAKQSFTMEAAKAMEAAKQAQMRKTAAEQAQTAAKASLKQLVVALATPLGSHHSSVWTLAYSPDGKRLASGAHRVGSEEDTATIRIWALPDGARLLAPK